MGQPEQKWSREVEVYVKTRIPCHPLKEFIPGQIRVVKYLFTGMLQLKMGLVKMGTKGHVGFQKDTPYKLNRKKCG
jgi:hypothetical protein